MSTVILPERGIVLHAPWWYAILYWGKRVENRGSRILYTGPLGMIAAARSDDDAVLAALRTLRSRGLVPVGAPNDASLLAEFRASAGHLVGVIQVERSEPNGPHPTDRWAVPNAIGWHLADPPIAVLRRFATGTQGQFHMACCPHCGLIGVVARQAGKVGRWLRCSGCKRYTAEKSVTRPELTVKAPARERCITFAAQALELDERATVEERLAATAVAEGRDGRTHEQLAAELRDLATKLRTAGPPCGFCRRPVNTDGVQTTDGVFCSAGHAHSFCARATDGAHEGLQDLNCRRCGKVVPPPPVRFEPIIHEGTAS